MQAFVSVSGTVAPLPAANVDTDVIMPKQFLKGVDRSGLKEGLFHDLRFDHDGAERPDFILNKPEWRDSAFLAVGPNFGCGSSREHAVWGLMQYGVRALIGTTFAGIFFDNCARNGLLAISMPEDRMDRVMQAVSSSEASMLTIDLEDQSIIGAGLNLPFDIDPMLKNALTKGLDAIGQTLTFRDEILAFQNKRLQENPWLV
jgi:3-isopropylmalate/(R)-2-methylmalate dehydratase small subunit